MNLKKHENLKQSFATKTQPVFVCVWAGNFETELSDSWTNAKALCYAWSSCPFDPIFCALFPSPIKKSDYAIVTVNPFVFPVLSFAVAQQPWPSSFVLKTRELLSLTTPC